MESFSLPRIPHLALSRRFPPVSQTLAPPPKRTTCFARFHSPISGEPSPIFSAGRRHSPAASHVASISTPSAFSGSGGAGDGLGSGGGGGDGDGDGGASRGKAEVQSLAGEPDEVSDLGSDVIILRVGGMSCGGCTASVKRILESQPQVSSATVNLETETAVVWVVPEIKATQNWQQQWGENLANHLTNCGFKSSLQAAGEGHAIQGELQS